MSRTKYVGPYTIEDFGYGRRQVMVWRHGWRDGRGKYDRARNVVGGHNGGHQTGLPVQLKAARLPGSLIPRKPATQETFGATAAAEVSA